MLESFTQKFIFLFLFFVPFGCRGSDVTSSAGTHRRLDSFCGEELLKSVKDNELDYMRYFLECRADVNYKSKRTGYSALILASIIGRKEAIETLLTDPRIDINATDKDGNTALIWATRYNRKDIVELLLTDPKINPNAVDNSGCTALIWACELCLGEIVERLLGCPRLDVKAVDNDGYSALDICADFGIKMAIEAFIGGTGTSQASK